jgi:hypothetical protein
MSSRWPAVVDYLLTLLPSLPGWSQVAVYDTDPVTSDAPAWYAVVARTSDDNTSGNYVRLIEPSGLINESGTVRVHIVTRTGNPDPASVRFDGFTLLDALEDALVADQDLGGVLGPLGTVDLTVDIQSVAGPGGVAQSLIVSVNYTSLT